MIFAGAAAARSSLAARLDISNPGCSTVEIDTPTIRRNPLRRYCPAGYKIDLRPFAVTKKRAGVPRLAARVSCWGLDQDTPEVKTPASGRCRPRGSRRSTG